VKRRRDLDPMIESSDMARHRGEKRGTRIKTDCPQRPDAMRCAFAFDAIRRPSSTTPGLRPARWASSSGV
jgi:hypothetical protein